MVLGISADSSAAQLKFKQQHQLPYTLLADTDKKVADAFGATGVDVTTLSEFRDALDQALGSRVPWLIGARVDQSRRAEWYDLLRG